jgi:nucleoside-diphosphate-sugar epimerase
MKRAFVTGASGFIGSAVVKRLLNCGWLVAVLQRRSTVGDRLRDVADQLHFIATTSDTVRDFELEFRRWQPDTVFHLGWAGVGSSHRNDAAIQMGNLQFSVELARLCADYGIAHFIGAGSQAEYGPKRVLIRESECPTPTTLYGTAKLSSCLLTQKISELAGCRHSWLRIFSTYGPGDNPDWLLPSLVRQLLLGQRPQLTPCEQTWDYLHVDDAAAAFEAVATIGATGIFNLASGVELPLRNFVLQVRDAVNPDLALGFGEVPYRSDQVMRMQVSIDRLRELANWQPTIDFRDGLAGLIESISRLHTAGK